MKHLDELLKTAVELRTLNTKISRNGRAGIVTGSTEHKALQSAISAIDAALEGGYKKSRRLSGASRADSITPNSVAVNKIRTRNRRRTYKLIEAYLKVVNDEL